MHPVNTLYYGDNLEVLRKHIGDESVDLVYLERIREVSSHTCLTPN